MPRSRFILLVAGLFGLTFIVISWAQKGFPVISFGAQPLRPHPSIPTFEESVARGAQKRWEVSKTNQSDGDGERDKLRIALRQAASAYQMSPCDQTMKKNLVEAVTYYAEAWHAKRNCAPGVDGCLQKADDRHDAANAAFKTPADLRIHAELGKAYAQGGIKAEDFPASVRRYVFVFAAPPPRAKAVCHAANAETRRR